MSGASLGDLSWDQDEGKVHVATYLVMTPKRVSYRFGSVARTFTTPGEWLAWIGDTETPTIFTECERFERFDQACSWVTGHFQRLKKKRG